MDPTTIEEILVCLVSTAFHQGNLELRGRTTATAATAAARRCVRVCGLPTIRQSNPIIGTSINHTKKCPLFVRRTAPLRPPSPVLPIDYLWQGTECRSIICYDRAGQQECTTVLLKPFANLPREKTNCRKEFLRKRSRARESVSLKISEPRRNFV